MRIHVYVLDRTSFNKTKTDSTNNSAVRQRDRITYCPVSSLLLNMFRYTVQWIWQCSHSMCSRLYETVERPSVCPSAPSFCRRTPLRLVCCCGPGGQEISIDWLLLRLLSAANSKCEQCHVVSWRSPKLNTDLLRVSTYNRNRFCIAVLYCLCMYMHVYAEPKQ